MLWINTKAMLWCLTGKASFFLIFPGLGGGKADFPSHPTYLLIIPTKYLLLTGATPG
jgi:hypothetical protein